MTQTTSPEFALITRVTGPDGIYVSARSLSKSDEVKQINRTSLFNTSRIDPVVRQYPLHSASRWPT